MKVGPRLELEFSQSDCDQSNLSRYIKILSTRLLSKSKPILFQICINKNLPFQIFPKHTKLCTNS